jgi:choline dehydrogenase-like flavoprotein
VELIEQMGDTDEAIGARVGSLDMGFATPKDVCDEGGNRDCMVVGTGGLRVVDASIIRLPLGAHYQATVYVLAENATDSICAIFCVGVIVIHV